MKIFECVFLFFFLVSFAACIDDQLEDEPNGQIPQQKTYPGVDEALWPHFRAFEEAASDRGISIDLAATTIRGTIEEIAEDNIAGTCSYGGRQVHRDVVIDQSFWRRANNLYREYIVFHELGHCYLFRDHYEACLANRTYASLMRSGNGDCRDNYNASTRSFYLDELFEQKGP